MLRLMASALIVRTAMTETSTPHPDIVSRDQWLKARQQLLAREKQLTRELDAVNALRRRLPMVRLEKDYVFEGERGSLRLLDLFEGQRQLIVYHFMFDPAWDKGCVGCTGFVDALGDLSMLQARNTNFVLVSRAPLAKLQAYRAERGWHRTWVSSYDSPFNYDFHVTLDEKVTPPEYNYRNQAELQQRSNEPWFMAGEAHGLSVFFRLGDEVFHSCSTYARGCESITDAYSLLDRTPYGRQEDFEDSPPGWPQKPTYG
jgi:predicted dithiol-disulfide oxidoreductase (DUF899 family)